MIEKGSLPADQMKDRTTEATPATPEDRDGSEDVVYLVSATEDGEGMNALRSRGGEEHHHDHGQEAEPPHAD